MLHMSLLRGRVVDVFEEDICRFDSLCIFEMIVESVSHAVQFLVNVD